MASLSPTDLTNLRTKRGTIIPYLSVFQPVTLLTAQVNNPSIARGARSIAYDNGTGTGYSTIAAGQPLLVQTSIGTKRVRVKSITGSQASGTITIAENGHIPWADNQVISILHDYPVWTIPPTIRGGVFYKDYNVQYGGQNLTPTPVAIAGPDKAGFISGGSAVFSLDATQSYATAQGASIAVYSWSCAKNGGSTSGITIASASSATTTLTITNAGAYWLKLTVTDSNGRGQNAYRLVFVYDDDNLPYKDFNLLSLAGSWNSGGWQATVEPFGDVTESDFPDFSRVLLWYQGYFDDTEYYVNVWPQGDNVLLNGYIRRDIDQDEPGQRLGRVDFDITTPEAVLDNTTDFGSVSLNSVSNPNTWYKYASWLSVGRAIHHELKWHTNFLDVWDCLGLIDNTLGVQNVDFTETSILQRANALAWGRGIFAKFVCNRLGQAVLVTDSQMLNTTARAALDTVFTLAATDLTDNINTLHQPEERGAAVDLDGFHWNGSASVAYISICPGYRESSVSYGMPGFRGASTTSLKNQVVSGQTDASEKAGRAYAVLTMPVIELRVETHSNYLGAFDIIPSLGWYVWGLSDGALKRDLALNGTKTICRDINVNPGQLKDGILQLEIVLEPEALGLDGIQGNYPVGYPAIPQPGNPDWPNTYDQAYIGTTDSGAFIKNFGQTPAASNSGLSGTSLNFRSIRLDPAFASALPSVRHLWAATEEGIAHSFNGGQSWTEVNESTFGTPENAAGDSPAPTTGDLDNIDLCFDPQDQYRMYLLRTTTSPNVRAWLYVADITDPAAIVWENYQVGIA